MRVEDSESIAIYSNSNDFVQENEFSVYLNSQAVVGEHSDHEADSSRVDN